MRLKVLSFALFLVLFSSSTCRAWGTATVSSRMGEVWLGNRLVLRVNSENTGSLVAQRLQKVLLSGVSSSQIWLQRNGYDYTIYAGKIPVITVTPSRARLNRTSTRSLAFLWAGRLRDALSRGIYLITPSRLVIPYGESRRLPVLGRYSGSLSVEIEDPKVSDFTGKEVPLVFKGLSPGMTRVKISVAGLSAYTNVFVKEWAGFIPEQVSLVVTGREVPRKFLNRAIWEALRQGISRKPLTRLHLEIPVESLPFVLGAGERMVLPVRARVKGKNYLSADRNLAVQIENKLFTIPPPGFLMVSNNPENFKSTGTLFRKDFSGDTPIRFFFHHHNQGGASLYFAAQLQNDSDHEVYVHILKGTGGPDTNEMHVGETAILDFFSSLKNQLGKIVKIKPGENYEVVSQMISGDEAFSGLLQITPLNERKLILSAVIEPGSGQPFKDIEMSQEKARKPRGVFPSPEIVVHASYSVGGNYAFITIGKGNILIDSETGKEDYGNYGVLYTVHVSITNPFPVPKTAHVMFVPQAGPGSGVFLVNGKDLLRTPVVSPFTPYPIVKVELDPGQTQTVTLQTIPQGGSFYPVYLVAQP